MGRSGDVGDGLVRRALDGVVGIEATTVHRGSTSAIEVRDKHCQHRSGCDIPAIRCDVDHIVPYSVRRDTSQFNGKLECRPHNRNSELHDHGEQPLPPRPVTRMDELRAKLAWRLRRELNRQRAEPDSDHYTQRTGDDDGESDTDEQAAS